MKALVNFIDYMQKHFSDVSQVPLVLEIRIFGIILKLLTLRMKILNFQTIFFKLLQMRQALAKSNFFFKTTINNMSPELLNKLTCVQFAQKIMQMEVIDCEQNTVIFRILKIFKKMKFFNLKKLQKLKL